MYFFQIKYTDAILSNSTRKLLWFEIIEMLIAVKNKFIVSFIIFSAHFRSLLPAKLFSRAWGIRPHSVHGSLEHRVHTPNGAWIDSSVFV